MDKTRLAFEQWWDGRQESLDRKAGAWDAWLYLTGNDTLAYRQAKASNQDTTPEEQEIRSRGGVKGQS